MFLHSRIARESRKDPTDVGRFTSPSGKRSQPKLLRPPALEAEGLSFSYGERKALSDVSFAIARGEVFGFLGPNGGGKTTLFRLLSTLIPIQSGRARVLGRDLAGDTIEIRRKMGVVFQHPSVDGKLTVLENLQHHGRLYGISGRRLKDRAAAMLDSLGLTSRSGDLVETLSGGMRRRVELAKAMLHQPELLLLDEPSTGLDPMARREFFGHLEQLSRRDNVTIVLTTHHMEEAERCDRIAMLHQGRAGRMRRARRTQIASRWRCRRDSRRRRPNCCNGNCCNSSSSKAPSSMAPCASSGRAVMN